jgi:signal transduction histidine kinase
MATAGILLASGGLVFWSGSKFVGAFSFSLQMMEEVAKVRSLQVLAARQKSAFDAYFLFGEAQYLEQFEELSPLVLDRLNGLGPAARGLQRDYERLLKAAAPVIASSRVNRGRALEQAAATFLPRAEEFFRSVAELEARIAEEVTQTYERMKGRAALAGRWILGLGLAGAILGLFLAVSTYRTMSRSLRLLQQGTTAFGGGKWDHRIPLPAQDELGQLAQSFNQMAENLKQLENQTVHMHRMSAVGQLAGGVAHEINNPLTGVLGQAQLLLQKLSAEDPARVSAQKIERAALRCKQIVRSLLDFSRQKKEAAPSDVDVNRTVLEALELCSTDILAQGVVVEKRLDPALPLIQGHEQEIQQVFLNLATNAIQAMPGGGTLTVTTRPRLSEDGSPSAVEAVFSDSGQGIALEHLRRIFEPFFTTKGIGQGTGLGLSISLGIVRSLGGDIQAESQGLGFGASFRVTLPLSQPLHAIPSPSSSSAEAPEPRFDSPSPPTDLS